MIVFVVTTRNLLMISPGRCGLPPPTTAENDFSAPSNSRQGFEDSERDPERMPARQSDGKAV